MASPRSGLSSQLGYGAESTVGTGVTPTRFLPHASVKIQQKIDRLESKGTIAGRRVLDANLWATGNITVSGAVRHELYNHQMTLLMKHAFGGYAVTGAGPYTHTMTPGDLYGLGLTIQAGIPDISGTVQPFTWAGCKVAKWELACKTGEIVEWGMDVVGMSETTATALASASYGTLTPITFLHGALTVSGSDFPAKAITLAGDNKLDAGRRKIGSATILEPIEADLREYGGTITAEFTNLTAYNRFVNGTTGALVLALTSGSDSYTFTANVRYDGETPSVNGRGVVELTLPFKCIGTTDAAALTLVAVNSDATA